MSRSSTILRNVASNWLGFVINAAVTLLLTPFVLRELGTARYGIWILTSSVIGYYGLLDLGFRSGVTQYLTRYLAAGDRERASACISSAVAVMGALGTAMLALSLGAAYAAPHVFELPGGLEREAFWSILMVGSASAIQFGLSPFTSIFTAKQRFDLANAIGVATRLLTAAGIVLSLYLHLGLIGLSAVTCLVSAVDYLIRWQVARRLAPEIEVARAHASWERVREIGGFGLWNSLVSINQFAFQHVPNLMIGTILPITAVGHYALAVGLFRQVNNVLSPVPQVVYPAATELHVKGDRSGLERLYHDASRLTMLVMVPLVLAAGFWAHDFYRLWIGEKFLTGAPFPSVALLFQILLLSTVTSYASCIAQQVLVGAGYVRQVAIALVCGSFISVTVGLILLRTYGLPGMAIGTVTASVVVDLIAMPVMLQHRLGLSIGAFVAKAFPRPIVAGVLQALLMMGIRLTGPANTWAVLFGQGAVAVAGSGVILLATGVTRDERLRLLVQPLRRVWPGRLSA